MNAIASPPSNSALRAIAAFVVVANVAFNYLYNRLGSEQRVDQISAALATTLTPAGYAFAIWGVIYAAFVVYCVQSLRKAHARDAAYDALAIPLALANLLAAAWIYLFTQGQIGAATLVIVATAAVGAWMFATAARAAPARPSRSLREPSDSHALPGLSDSRLLRELSAPRSPREPGHSCWLRVPFALFFGWITVATFAGISQWMNARGWLDSAGIDRMVSVTFLAIAAVAATFVARRFIEPVYPLVVAWAAGAVFVAQRGGDSVVAYAALAVALIALLAAAWAAHEAWNTGRPEQAAHA